MLKKYLDLFSTNIAPTNCILEALELCLTCKNSIFNNESYLQIDGTAQGPHISCFYAQGRAEQGCLCEPPSPKFFEICWYFDKMCQ